MYTKQGLKYYKKLRTKHNEGRNICVNFIEVHFNNKVVFCGTIYRAPKQSKQSVSEFLTTLKLLFKTISNTKMTCYVMEIWTYIYISIYSSISRMCG